MQENFHIWIHKLRGLMDAISASVVGGVSQTSTSDTNSCPPQRPTLTSSSPTDFCPILSPPPLTKSASVSLGPSVTTNAGFSLPHPLSSTSVTFPPSPFHVCAYEGQLTPVKDVTDREDEHEDVSLKELSHKLQEFAKARDWEKYHTPRNLLLAMVGEVGELSEIFQWKGEVKRGLEDWEESEKVHLGEELSDVLLYLIRLADICGIDLANAAQDKILKNAIKYPLPPPLDH